MLDMDTLIAAKILGGKGGGGGGSAITVDDEISSSSTNPVQNKVIAIALEDKQDTMTIDDAISLNSTNPVQNSVIAEALGEKVSFESMTMAEYEMLSQSEKMDGTMRFITDSDGENLISKQSLGLGNVDNTSDMDKPVSTAQRKAIDEMHGKTYRVGGTDAVIIAQPNTRYICGELSTLDFTPCSSGVCDIMFTSGSSKTILTLPNTVKMPDGFEVEADTIYEINVLDGVYGVVASWPT